MGEIITAINEVADESGKDSWENFDGYEVVTDKQRITLLIENGQSCCERAGYFMSEDDVQSYVGAELLGIAITDTALNEAAMRANELNPDDQWFDGGVMFVNLQTDRGTLQFVAYNVHNGYYGHTARVTSAQLVHEERL